MTPSARDAPRPLGRPGRRRPAARARPRAGRLAFGDAPDPGRPPAAGAVAAPALDARCSPGSRGIVGDEHVLTDDDLRRRRTRGKSTPDLLRSRAGDFADAPDAVVRPGGHDEVAAVLAYAAAHRVALVPFGGGTSRHRRPGRAPRRPRRPGLASTSAG